MQYCVYKTRSVWLEIRARYKKSSVITVSEHHASRGNYLTVIGYKEVREVQLPFWMEKSSSHINGEYVSSNRKTI